MEEKRRIASGYPASGYLAKFMPNPKAAAPTQQFLAIDQIKDGVVILKTGGLRMILMASSINFELKASEEQDLIISSYQGFLNSLDFPTQFVIQSRKLNIKPYLEMLRQREKEQPNELLKIQINEYREFVQSLVETQNIMSKTFYAVVSYAPVEIKSAGLLEQFTTSLKPKKAVMKEEKFAEHRAQLLQRVEAVSAGLGRLGVRTIPLKTEELVELFYGLYNPGETEKKGEQLMKQLET